MPRRFAAGLPRGADASRPSGDGLAGPAQARVRPRDCRLPDRISIAFFPVAVPYVDLYRDTPGNTNATGTTRLPAVTNCCNGRRRIPCSATACAEDVAEWESRLDVSRLPAYADHRVGGEILFPAAAFAEIALAACAALREVAAREIEDLTIHAPLVLDRGAQQDAAPDRGRGRRSHPDSQPYDPRRGRLAPAGERPGAACRSPRNRLRRRFRAAGARAMPFSADAHYAALAAMGLDYGPAFRAVTQAWVEPGGVAATLVAARAEQTRRRRAGQLEPSALDACFQLIVHLQKPDPDGAEPIAFVPVHIGRLRVVRPGQRLAYARLRETQRGPRSAEADCVLYGADRQPIASRRTCASVRYRAANPASSSRCAAARSRCRLPGLPRRCRLPPIQRLARRLRRPPARRRAGSPRASAITTSSSRCSRQCSAAFAQEALPALEATLGAIAGDPQRIEWIRVRRRQRRPAAADRRSGLNCWPTRGSSEEILHLGRIGMHFADLAGAKPRGIEIGGARPGGFRDALAHLVRAATAPADGRASAVRPRRAGGFGPRPRMTSALDRDRADCRVYADPGGARPARTSPLTWWCSMAAW